VPHKRARAPSPPAWPGVAWRGKARQAGRPASGRGVVWHGVRCPSLDQPHARPFSFSFPSAACETLLLQLPFRGRLRRGERLSLGTHEQNTFRITVQSLVRVFPSRNSARIEEREGRCLRSPCRSRPCMGDRQLGFWGASTRLPNVHHCLLHWFLTYSSHTDDKRSWTRTRILGAHGRV
jgi:hypothetical protein